MSLCCESQLTRRLYDHVWESWCADTAVLVDGLPAALRAGGPAPQKLGQTLERWLLLLKVVLLPVPTMAADRLSFAFPSELANARSVRCLQSQLGLAGQITTRDYSKSSICLVQVLRRLVMFGFPSDARTLEQVPAVVQVRLMMPSNPTRDSVTVAINDLIVHDAPSCCLPFLSASLHTAPQRRAPARHACLCPQARSAKARIV